MTSFVYTVKRECKKLVNVFLKRLTVVICDLRHIQDSWPDLICVFDSGKKTFTENAFIGLNFNLSIS